MQHGLCSVAHIIKHLRHKNALRFGFGCNGSIIEYHQSETAVVVADQGLTCQ